MANRFEHNNDEFPEDLFGMNEEDQYDDYEDDETDEILQGLELDRKELNSKILFRTIRCLERSWFWRFRSETSKRRLIEENYRRNLQLIALGEWEYVDHQSDN